MKTKTNQAPVYLVINNYAEEISGSHPLTCVLVREEDAPKTVDGAKTYRAVLTGEIHRNCGDGIYASRAAAQRAYPELIGRLKRRIACE